MKPLKSWETIGNSPYTDSKLSNYQALHLKSSNLPFIITKNKLF